MHDGDQLHILVIFSDLLHIKCSYQDPVTYKYI